MRRRHCFALVGVLVVDDNINLHSSDCQNTSDRNLRSGVHLEVPDNENWQDTQDPITDTGNGRVGVEAVDGKFWVDAGSGMLSWISLWIMLGPEEG